MVCLRPHAQTPNTSAHWMSHPASSPSAAATRPVGDPASSEAMVGTRPQFGKFVAPRPGHGTAPGHWTARDKRQAPGGLLNVAAARPESPSLPSAAKREARVMSEGGELLVNATGLAQRSWCVRRSILPAPGMPCTLTCSPQPLPGPSTSSAERSVSPLRRPLHLCVGSARPRVKLQATLGDKNRSQRAS